MYVYHGEVQKDVGGFLQFYLLYEKVFFLPTMLSGVGVAGSVTG